MSFKACVFGNPIAQSKSPIIHTAFAKQFNLPLSYNKIQPEIENFEIDVMSFFKSSSAIGANVTAPFKERAFELVDELNTQAKRSGAVNTLIVKDNKLIGDNTDGRGLVNDLKETNIDLNGLDVLVIGAGGAAKGVIPALSEEGIASIDIYNRTLSRAERLIHSAMTYSAIPIDFYRKDKKYDLVINATTLSLSSEIPNIDSSAYESALLCYDMVYQAKPTSFMSLCQRSGAKNVKDGLGMLVGQAAVSFELWFEKKPETKSLLTTLRGF